MRKPLELDEVLRCVDGTSYDIPREDQSLARLGRLLERARRIETRYEGICETMGPVVGARTVEQRAYQTHHSMRLELEGPPDLRTTQNLVAGLPQNVEILAREMTRSAIESDDHLVSVIGAYGAELLAERIAESFKPGSTV